MSEFKNDIQDAVEEPTQAAPAAAKKKKRLGARIAVAVCVVVILLVAGGTGMFFYTSTPQGCATVCHTPMGAYADTYNQPVDTAGTDKWGNEVSNTSSMLAVTHKDWNSADCVDCHKRDQTERLVEVGIWATGDYYFPLVEWSGRDLAEVYATDEDSLCLNESCHNMTREDLIKETMDVPLNPHSMQHGAISCTSCHKAHRASVMYCAQCHEEATVPEGWLTPEQDEALYTGEVLPEGEAQEGAGAEATEEGAEATGDEAATDSGQ